MQTNGNLTTAEQAQAEQIIRQTFPKRVHQYRITVRPVSRSEEDGPHYVMAENQQSGKRYVIGCYSTQQEAHRINRMADYILGGKKHQSRMRRATTARKRSGSTVISAAEYPIHDIKALRSEIRKAKPEIPNIWARAKASKKLETFRLKPMNGWIISGYNWHPKTEEVTPAILSGAEHIARLDLARAMEIFDRAALWRALMLDTSVQNAFDYVQGTLDLTSQFQDSTDPKAFGVMMATRNQLISEVDEAQKEMLNDYSDIKAQPWSAIFIAKRWHRKNLSIAATLQKLISQAEKFGSNITATQWQEAVKQSEIDAHSALDWAFSEPKLH